MFVLNWFLGAVFAVLLIGQVNAQSPSPLRFIDVEGNAEIEIEPDEIFISIELRERTNDKEKETVLEQEEALVKGLTKIGIDTRNLTLRDAGADYVKVGWQRKEVLTQKEFVLKVKNAEEVGKTFQLLDSLEIRDASITRVDHSKMDSLRKEVKIMAIKNAKEKAFYLLEAIGDRCGQTMEVSEFMYGSQIVKTYDRNAYEMVQVKKVSNSYNDSSNLYNSEIQFEKIKLTGSIRVRFAIL
jgi:uncharacterized protein YggE